MPDRDSRAQLVRFWRTVEMFSPQNVPKLTQITSSGGVLDVGANELAPWEKGHPLQAVRLPEDRTWQFTVFGGRYDISAARNELVRVFGADGKPDDARRGGETAMFAFTLDAEGYMLPDTAVLSSCSWAVGRLRSSGPGNPTWLDGFEDDERAFGETLNKLVPPKPRAKAADGESALRDHAKGAVRVAVSAAAHQAGDAVGTMTATAVGSVAGSVVGGIAGKAAGAFVGSFLTPPGRGATHTPGLPPVVPRLRITGRALNAFVTDLAAAMGVDVSLKPAGVRVRCARVPKKGGDEAEPAFLNSLIAEDLARIETAVREDDCGTALGVYLADAENIPTSGRVDVRTTPSAVLSGVGPCDAPAGRWPAATTRPLVVSQQFAVNQIMRELASGKGVFAVNGPPGTGKTTMLRDVLSAIVVERAGRLAALRKPADAFTGVVDRVELAPKYTATVRALRPELVGFEIVVATASNDAAKNVTAEIPGLAAVGGAEKDALAADYFPALASNVLDADAWGMVAAVLGNMMNRSTFTGRFWYGDSAPGRVSAEPVVGMRDILREVQANPDRAPDWGTAVKAFRDAEATVRRLADERRRVAGRIDEFSRHRSAIPGLTAGLRDASDSCDNAKTIAAGLTETLDQVNREYRELDDELDRHVTRKPGFWISLSTFFRAGRRWYAEYELLTEHRAKAKDRRDELAGALSRHKSELTEALLVRQRCDNALRDAEHGMASARADIDAAAGRWPGTVPFSEHADDESVQLSTPWADQEFTAARNEVFLAALRLHKAFLLNAVQQIRGNLAVACAALRGWLPITEHTSRAAWQAFFLVVPMISTTFASLPRLFRGLGRESFGWLFIDEAGQATPQQAAGGLWRSQRAVIVGDPRQLEPIVTLPSSAQDAMRRYYRVSDEWSPDGTSVQRVADRLARHGTYLAEPDGETTVWVGAPLRVHRRCDHPIFTVSNTIAYGGDLMVYGTADRDPFPGQNVWLDVPSGQSHGNWVPAEGDALIAVLDELRAYDVNPGEIRVISPFRDVVRGSKAIAERRFGQTFARDNVGTVHTVQGQESDVIVLILGSAPANEGARRWAAAKPNLLNVAASRAKRRLYVIGDRGRWRSQPYFSTLATTIGHRPTL